MKISILETEDGSHSLYRADLRESYHSLKGALQESRHVYIQEGLLQFPQQEEPLKIFELGFGTGLNALLASHRALDKKQSIYFHSLEPYPLSRDIWENLNYPAQTGKNDGLWNKLHESTWGQEVMINEFVTLLKEQKTLEEADLNVSAYDIVFYDAFAPSKQPELWTLEPLEKVVKAMKPGALLVTYCAQGQFKRNLKTLGMEVETLKGPPGKKEMVRGQKR
jgi:tRNA U34 5-methylaminomethyl-2-thiouridine-forming methyltransferase MnmC